MDYSESSLMSIANGRKLDEILSKSIQSDSDHACRFSKRNSHRINRNTTRNKGINADLSSIMDKMRKTNRTMKIDRRV